MGRPARRTSARDPDSGPTPAGQFVTPADAALLELLRAIRRDVAHELRGPVQSVVVNAEVTRRRLAAGDTAGAAERIDVVEEEVRRIHQVADAYLSLLTPPPPERRVFDVASVLDQVEPLLRVLARAARTGLRRIEHGAAPLARACPDRLAFALVRIAIAVNEAAGPGGDTAFERRVSPATVDILGSAVSAAPSQPGAEGEAALARAEDDVRLWLQGGDGTVERLTGSDPDGPRGFVIRLPRADFA